MQNNAPEFEDIDVIDPIDEESPISFEIAVGESSEVIVGDDQSGWRLDLFLVHYFPVYSRTHIRNAIMSGGVSIFEPGTDTDPGRGKPGFRLKPGQRIVFSLPKPSKSAAIPEPIPLDVLYEDESLVVINKPSGMVVHPSRGHWAGTLVGALAHHFSGRLSSVRGPERPGIVHRLDRDTTGAILIAKNDTTHTKLALLFQEKRIRKEYLALVIGTPEIDRDMIDAPIGQHPKQKEKMAIRKNDPEAKEAQTFYEVIERFRGFAHIRCQPMTGRTHQIRVHLTHAGYPILCDRLYYSSRSMITLEEIAGKQPIAIRGEPQGPGTVLLSRQALHAEHLTFVHPESGKELSVTAPLPADIASVLEALRCHRS